MTYAPIDKDYKLLKQRYKQIELKLKILTKDMIPYGEIKGNVLDYSLDIDSSSEYRRIFSADLIVADNALDLLQKDSTLLNWIVQPILGYKDIGSTDITWYLLGTFVFSTKSYTYDANTNILSIRCNDMMACLDGSLGGNLKGVNNVQIYAYKDNLYYSLVKSIYDSNHSTLCTLFTSNAKMTLPLPNHIWDTAYREDLTQHMCGHKNAGNVGISGGKVNIILRDFNEIKNTEVFAIHDIDANTLCNITVTGSGECSYLLNDTTGSILDITALTTVYILRIEVYDFFVSEEYPIVIWNFGSEYTIYDGYSSVYPTPQSCKAANILATSNSGISGSVTDILLTDERFTLYGNEVVINGKLEKCAVRGYEYNYDNDTSKSYYITQPMIATIDTTEGEQTTVQEVVKAVLDQAEVTKYHLDNITEVIPYDLELSSNLTYNEILSQIASLYEDIEMFFDVDGVFVMRHIPTTDESPIYLEYKDIRPLIIDEQYDEDLTSFYNVTEIWGGQIEADYYALDNGEDIIVDYNTQENCINLSYDNIATSDSGEIINGTVLGIFTPDNIKNHAKGLSVRINNVGGNTINTANINIEPMWQLNEDLYWNTIQPFRNTAKISAMPYKNVVFYGCKNKTGENEGTYRIITSPSLNVFNTLEKYMVDGINFCYYCDHQPPGRFNTTSPGSQLPLCTVLILTRPNYIYNHTEGTKYLDVHNLENCIKFRAKRGQVVRFYFVYQSGLSIADENGKILTGQMSDVNIDHDIWYMDFFPIAENEKDYYVFDGITSVTGEGIYTDGSCAVIFGMSKFNYTFPAIPVYDSYTNDLLDQGFLKPNESYCFQYMNNTLKYLGQWKVHAVAIEMKEIPSDLDMYYQKYNTKNLIISQYNITRGVDVVGEKNQILIGDDYDNIYSDGLCLERADWENWKAARISKSLTIKSIAVPWLDVATKITYKANNDIVRQYLVNRIHYDSNGIMTFDITPFYPRYKDLSGLRVNNMVSTIEMVNALPNDNTTFSNSLWNYNLFDYKYYANRYSDLKNKYGYNAQQLWQHWNENGIQEGRRCSIVYDPVLYQNYTEYQSNRNAYINKIRSAFGSAYSNESVEYMAMYLHFLDSGIKDRNVICSREFDIKVYSEYEDLKKKYGYEWRKYYEHCVKYNYVENRVCI